MIIMMSFHINKAFYIVIREGVPLRMLILQSLECTMNKLILKP